MKISLISLLLVVATVTQAQQFLYLKKFRTAKRERVELYSTMKVKTQDTIVKGQLYQVGPDFIMVGNEVVMLEDIEWIRTIHPFWKGLGRSLEIGAVVFGGIILVNGIILGWVPLFTPTAAILLSSVFLTGVILELVAIRTYRAKKGWIYEPLIMDDL